ncbi:hypothetical protein [Bdellovibrio sp. HCB-162]|uniref:hypothetical protein n=1 Tax=Bdellovibrio sp. HCB-162 TaxID=3394234 RepID=UPI0039BCCBE1
MKTLIMTFALVLSGASAEAKISSRLEGNTCIECSSASNRAAQQLRDIRNTITSDAKVEDIFSINEKMNFADKCENFADDDGLGRWGTTIVNELHRERYAELYEGTADIKAVCPAFATLNDNAKELVWVMVINAMVHLESSCQKGETAKGPNGTLIGLMQLHKGRESVYAKGCRNGDGNSPDTTFRCGLSMLNKQLANDDALFSRKSYWDVLRPQARSQKYKKVQSAVRKLSFCK